MRALERLGFEKVRQTGSHVVMKKATKESQIGCARYTRNLHVGTLSGILKLAQVLRESLSKVYEITN